MYKSFFKFILFNFFSLTPLVLFSVVNSWLPHSYMIVLTSLSIQSIIYICGIDLLLSKYLRIQNDKPSEYTLWDYYHIIQSQAVIVLGWYFLEPLMLPDNIYYLWQYMTIFLVTLPYMFMFDVIFDFFHYWFHRGLHAHPILFNKIHKHHHIHKNPSSIHAFYQHPLDPLITNVIPMYLTFFILPALSKYQWCIITQNRLIVEIIGHSGKDIRTKFNIKYFFLEPYFQNIKLDIHDHDRHHSHFHCNYSKRLSLWDKLFNTYSKGEQKEQ